MKKELKFYRCPTCGNITLLLEEGAGQMVCCGQPMQLMVPGATDAAQEKHLPVGVKEGGKVLVTVGEVEHPMTPEHHISWVVLLQNGKTQVKKLDPAGPPKAEFAVEDEGEILLYEYCNLHGLWSAEV